MKNRIFNEEIHQIDSFDAYYKNVILRNNNLIIPYINLGISNHPLNSSEIMLFVDFAYMVFEDDYFIDVFVNGNRLNIINTKEKNYFFHFGGTYLDFSYAIFNDMKISCKQASLHILEISRLSKQMWIPTTTPNFEKNIESGTSADFFENKYITSHIRALIK